MQQANDQELFRGHIEECLRHLNGKFDAKINSGAKGCAQAKKPLADFCQVNIDTISHWLRGQRIPTGEKLLKLICYLRMLGYRIIEWENNQFYMKNFCELIGFGVLCGDESAQMLGYSNSAKFYRVYHGDCGISEEKKQKMRDIWKGKKQELEQKKSQFAGFYGLIFTQPSKTDLAEGKPITVSSNSLAVIFIMAGLHALFNEGRLENLDDAQIVVLREHKSMILELAVYLDNLCSRLVKQNVPKGGD